ncbi:hypothetical protein V8F33_006338 [Rhypophila sp. PSN 637]
MQSLSVLLLFGFSALVHHGLALPMPLPSDGKSIDSIDTASSCALAEPKAHGTINSRDNVKPRCVV